MLPHDGVGLTVLGSFCHSPTSWVSAEMSASGTVMVTGASVLNASVTWKFGLIAVGLANFQNSARWKASTTCVVPSAVPPYVWALALTIGEFCVRASALAPGSQLSTLV